MNIQAVAKMIIALARALDVDPYDLAMTYMDEDENQEFFEKFLALADESED